MQWTTFGIDFISLDATVCILEPLKVGVFLCNFSVLVETGRIEKGHFESFLKKHAPLLRLTNDGQPETFSGQSDAGFCTKKAPKQPVSILTTDINTAWRRLTTVILSPMYLQQLSHRSAYPLNSKGRGKQTSQATSQPLSLPCNGSTLQSREERN